MSARKRGGGDARGPAGDALVWSSERGGRVRPQASPRGAPRDGDGIVRVRRETSGRRGKTVTTVLGVPLAEDGLRELAAALKRRCGSGGSAKEGKVEIQGDHRDAVIAELEARGYTVKRAGG